MQSRILADSNRGYTLLITIHQFCGHTTVSNIPKIHKLSIQSKSNKFLNCTNSIKRLRNET